MSDSVIGDELAAALKSIPVLRYLKDPVVDLNDLYIKYPQGGEYGWYAFVLTSKAFAYWDTEELKWKILGAAGVPDGFPSWESYVAYLVANNLPVPESFTTWDEYVTWLVTNNFPVPDEFVSWEELAEWLIANQFPIPEGFSSWEEYFNYLRDQNFPIPEITTWEQFINWLEVNEFLPPDGYATWAEYLNYLITNGTPVPDQFTTWEELITWLTTNTINLPEGFTTFEEYIEFLLDQNFLLPEFSTWQEFIDWLELNDFTLPTGFDSIENYVAWYVSQAFPLPDQFSSWEEFINWLTAQNSYPVEFNSWEEYITSLIEKYYGTGGEDTGTYRIYGTVTWKENLDYIASDFKAKILGTIYTAQGRKITLEAADPLLPRKDVFVMDRFGNIFARTGTPAADPVKPTVNYDELEITHADIAAGATEPSNVNSDKVFDEGEPGEWTATHVADNNVTVNAADLAHPNTGTKHISTYLNIPDAEGNSPTHYVGEHYQGGIIFHLDSGGKSGLIAALEDQHTGEKYEALRDGDPYTTGATGVAIGTGQANTGLLADHSHNATMYAVRACLNYRGGGYSDWFLGSRDEMGALYYRRNVVGGFAAADYWTSSEINWKEAYSVRFSDGYITDRDKDKRFRIRAIRKFDDSQQSYLEPVEVYSPEEVKINFEAPAPTTAANGILVFALETSQTWLAESGLLIESWNGGARTGGVLLKRVNNYGFKDSVTGYQHVAISLSDFGVSTPDLTAISFRLVDNWKNLTKLNLDTVRVQYDEAQVPQEPNAILKSATLDENAKLTFERSNDLAPLKVQFGTMALKGFWIGTQAEYDAIAAKDANTIYHIEEE